MRSSRASVVSGSAREREEARATRNSVAVVREQERAPQPSEPVATRPKRSSQVLWLKLNFTVNTAKLQSLKRNKYQHLQEEALLKARGLLQNWENGEIVLTEDLLRSAASDEEAQELMQYTPEALAVRFSLRNDPRVVQAIKDLWSVDVPRDELGCIDRHGYIDIFRRIAKSLDIKAYRQHRLRQTIEQDWIRDSRGESKLGFASFFDSMFELVDLWCETIHAEDYARFLTNLRDRITRNRSSRRVLRKLTSVVAMSSAAQGPPPVVVAQEEQPSEEVTGPATTVDAPNEAARQMDHGHDEHEQEEEEDTDDSDDDDDDTGEDAGPPVETNHSDVTDRPPSAPTSSPQPSDILPVVQPVQSVETPHARSVQHYPTARMLIPQTRAVPIVSKVLSVGSLNGPLAEAAPRPSVTTTPEPSSTSASSATASSTGASQRRVSLVYPPVLIKRREDNAELIKLSREPIRFQPKTIEHHGSSNRSSSGLTSGPATVDLAATSVIRRLSGPTVDNIAAATKPQTAATPSASSLPQYQPFRDEKAAAVASNSLTPSLPLKSDRSRITVSSAISHGSNLSHSTVKELGRMMMAAAANAQHARLVDVVSSVMMQSPPRRTPGLLYDLDPTWHVQLDAQSAADASRSARRQRVAQPVEMRFDPSGATNVKEHHEPSQHASVHESSAPHTAEGIFTRDSHSTIGSGIQNHERSPDRSLEEAIAAMAPAIHATTTAPAHTAGSTSIAVTPSPGLSSPKRNSVLLPMTTNAALTSTLGMDQVHVAATGSRLSQPTNHSNAMLSPVLGGGIVTEFMAGAAEIQKVKFSQRNQGRPIPITTLDAAATPSTASSSNGGAVWYRLPAKKVKGAVYQVKTGQAVPTTLRLRDEEDDEEGYTIVASPWKDDDEEEPAVSFQPLGVAEDAFAALERVKTRRARASLQSADASPSKRIRKKSVEADQEDVEGLDCTVPPVELAMRKRSAPAQPKMQLTNSQLDNNDNNNIGHSSNNNNGQHYHQTAYNYNYSNGGTNGNNGSSWSSGYRQPSESTSPPVVRPLPVGVVYDDPELGADTTQPSLRIRSTLNVPSITRTGRDRTKDSQAELPHLVLHPPNGLPHKTVSSLRYGGSRERGSMKDSSTAPEGDRLELEMRGQNAPKAGSRRQTTSAEMERSVSPTLTTAESPTAAAATASLSRMTSSQSRTVQASQLNATPLPTRMENHGFDAFSEFVDSTTASSRIVARLPQACYRPRTEQHSAVDGSTTEATMMEVHQEHQQQQQQQQQLSQHYQTQHQQPQQQRVSPVRQEITLEVNPNKELGSDHERGQASKLRPGHVVASETKTPTRSDMMRRRYQYTFGRA